MFWWIGRVGVVCPHLPPQETDLIEAAWFPDILYNLALQDQICDADEGHDGCGCLGTSKFGAAIVNLNADGFNYHQLLYTNVP